MGLGRYFSSALFLLPRVSPEFHLQKPRRQFKTHCLKLSSRMGLLPGVLRGPRRLLPGAVSLNSKGGVLLQHVSQLSLSSSSRYSGFKLLPPWHQVPHAFGSQVFIPPTTTTKGRPWGHRRSSVFYLERWLSSLESPLGQGACTRPFHTHT